MTIHVITVTETADQLPGLAFTEPVLLSPTPFSVGMERNATGQPRQACRNEDERRGWDVAQSMKEL